MVILSKYAFLLSAGINSWSYGVSAGMLMLTFMSSESIWDIVTTNKDKSVAFVGFSRWYHGCRNSASIELTLQGKLTPSKWSHIDHWLRTWCMDPQRALLSSCFHLLETLSLWANAVFIYRNQIVWFWAFFLFFLNQPVAIYPILYPWFYSRCLDLVDPTVHMHVAANLVILSDAVRQKVINGQHPSFDPTTC